MSDEAAKLIAKKFIARQDVVAVQRKTGAWSPLLVDPRDTDSERIPWRMKHLRDHVEGRATYGHYLLSQDDTCKLFAFDIDLEKNGDPDKQEDAFLGTWVDVMHPDKPVINEDELAWKVKRIDPRQTWHDYYVPGGVAVVTCHPCGATWRMDYEESKCSCAETPTAPDASTIEYVQRRPIVHLTVAMRTMANRLARHVAEMLEVPVAMAYSGSKGLHVYGFTGEVPASEARDAGLLVLEEAGFHASRGANFFKSNDDDPYAGERNFSVELFPKQTSLDGKDLGNLMRLPLGKNQRGHEGFFIDNTAPYSVLTPADPIKAMTQGNPWQ